MAAGRTLISSGNMSFPFVLPPIVPMKLLYMLSTGSCWVLTRHTGCWGWGRTRMGIRIRGGGCCHRGSWSELVCCWVAVVENARAICRGLLEDRREFRQLEQMKGACLAAIVFGDVIVASR